MTRVGFQHEDIDATPYSALALGACVDMRGVRAWIDPNKFNDNAPRCARLADEYLGWFLQKPTPTLGQHGGYTLLLRTLCRDLAMCKSFLIPDPAPGVPDNVPEFCASLSPPKQGFLSDAGQLRVFYCSAFMLCHVQLRESL